MVAIAFIPWGINTLYDNYIVGISILAAVPVAIALSIWFFLTERRMIASGLPIQDERSKKIFQKATSYSFYSTMYFVLFFSFLIDEPYLKDCLTVERALLAALAEMVIACFVFLGYFHLRGVPE